MHIDIECLQGFHIWHIGNNGKNRFKDQYTQEGSKKNRFEKNSIEMNGVFNKLNRAKVMMQWNKF